MKPRLLDAFCGIGGAGAGYALAGFEVVGVDHRYFSNYLGGAPSSFILADALDYLARHGHEYDAIHASPPCQAHSAARTMKGGRQHRDFIADVRALLDWLGLPYIIENVPGAPLINPTLLCGTMFGLGVPGAELRRHRLFESNIALSAPGPCQHGQALAVIGVYGGKVRDLGARGRVRFHRQDGADALGIHWATNTTELSQAIPPAYTRHLGAQLLAAIGESAPTPINLGEPHENLARTQHRRTRAHGG